MTNTVLYYTGPVDDMAQIMIKRQMKALFGGVNTTNNNNNVNNGSKKRKHSSLVDDNNTELDDDGSSSLPSLELEDDALSELEDSVFDDSSKDEREKKRRKKLRREFPSDLIVVLDMDECLIHFKAQQEQDNNNNEEKENNNHNHNGVVQENPSLLYVNEHQVLLRPGLVEFLKFVTTRFQTHIFTAGTQEYADAILDQLSKLVVNHSNSTTTTTSIQQEDIFCKRWYRDDCDTIDILNPLQVDRRGWCSIESIYVKPLSKVAVWAGRDGDDLSRIVHIDDQPKNFLLNYSNGISVKEWKGDCDRDCGGGVDQILQSVTKVLERIDAKPDVRPHLRNESYLALKDHLDLLHLFPHRRTKGIGSTFLA